MFWDLNFLWRCKASPQKISEAFSNSHYETNFGVCSAEGAANPKIGFVESPPLADFQQNQYL
jgi:hypothetical protein